jgi:hypothetical protein
MKERQKAREKKGKKIGVLKGKKTQRKNLDLAWLVIWRSEV